MRKIIITVTIIIGSIIALVALLVAYAIISEGRHLTHPDEDLLRRPVEEIREYLLELTPVGTHVTEVVAVIEGRETWRFWGVNERFGFAMRNGRPSEPNPNDIAAGNVIGTQSIRVELGSYWGSMFSIYITHVTVFWGFDENSQLIDIQVRK